MAAAWPIPGHGTPVLIIDGNDTPVGTASNPLVVSDGSSIANVVTGAATTNGGTAVEVIAAPAAGKSIYVTDLQFGNTSASLVTVALNDTVTSTFVVPSNGGSNIHLSSPLKVAAATHLTFTSSSPQTSIYCNAQGYTA